MSVRNTVKSIQDIMRQDVGVDGDAQRISQVCWMFFLKIIDDQDKELEIAREGYRSPIPKKLQWRAWAADPEGITGDRLLDFINDELFPALKELPANGKPGDRRRVVREVFADAYNYMKSGQLIRQVVNKIQDVNFNNLADRQHFGDIYEQLLNDLQSAGNAGEYYTPRALTAFMAERIDPKPGEILLDPACGTGGFLTCALRHMRDRYVKKVKDEEKMRAGLRAVEKKQLPHMLCVTNMLLHGIEDPSFVRHDNTLARAYTSYSSSDRVDIVLTNPPFGGREEDGIESNFPKHFQTRETADLFLALIVRLLKPGGRAAVVLPDGSLFGEGIKTRLKEHVLEECNLHTIVRLPNSVFKPYASIGTNLLFFEKGEPTKTIWFYEHRVPDGQKAYSMTKPIRVEHLQPCVDWWGGPTRKGRKETEVAWKVTANDVKTRGYNLDCKNPHVVADDHGDPEELLKKLDDAEEEAAKLRNQLKAILEKGAAAMNQARFLSRFECIIDAPDAIPLLRRLIVGLAVSGKLVEPGANDEAAATVLMRIQAIKAASLGKASRAKEYTQPILGDEAPLSLSPGTIFARLDEIAKINKGTTGIQKAKPGPYPLVTLAEARSTSADYQFDTAAAIVPLISSTGHGHASLKRMHYQDGKFALGNILCAVIPFAPDLISARFIYEYLWAYKESLLVAKMIGTANVSLAIGKIGEAPIPIISTRAQARLSELMGLCDRLEDAQKERESRRDRLAAASLHRLNQVADGNAAAFRDHARFHLRHLPRITARPEQIAALRQTILSLAVQGKLVPQDPGDEPASQQLQAIRAEKAKFVAKQMVKKSEPSRPIDPEEFDYDIPHSWAWVRLVEICELITDGTHQTPKYTETGRAFLSAQNVKPFKFMPAKHRFVSEEHYQGYVKNRKPEKGDVLLTRVGAGIGEAATIDQNMEFAIYVSVGLVRPVRGFVSSDYITLWLNSPDGTEKSRRNTYGKGASQGNLNLSLIRNFLVPLPPLAEQHRIVARFGELMANCDRLEAQLTKTQTESRRLLEAVLHEALAPAKPEGRRTLCGAASDGSDRKSVKSAVDD